MSIAQRDFVNTRSDHRLSMQTLGLSVEEESIYRALLREPGLTTPLLSQSVGIPAEALEELLACLRRRGIVRYTDDPVPVWEPTNPEIAVELLLMERQLELMEARKLVPDLRDELAKQVARPLPTDVQVLPREPATQMGAYLSLFDQARSRLDFIVMPPFLATAPDSVWTAREAARRRGVRIRVIISTEVIRWTGWQAAIASSVSAGDEYRLLDAPPFKLAMADRQAALLPLRDDDGDGPALRLGNVAIMKALDCLYESLWLQAVPIEITPRRSGEDSRDRDALTDELITVLASGANDKTVANILGISDRTLQRRLGLLNAQLRAKSRFHAGWLAALRRNR